MDKTVNSWVIEVIEGTTSRYFFVKMLQICIHFTCNHYLKNYNFIVQTCIRKFLQFFFLYIKVTTFNKKICKNYKNKNKKVIKYGYFL